MAETTEERKQDEAGRVADKISICQVSREQRLSVCAGLRAEYERGTEDGPRATYNKLRSHLDRVGSYLFAPDTVRFSPRLPVTMRKLWTSAAGVARDEFRLTWHDAGADLIIDMMTLWSLVYGATLGKLQPDPHTGFRLGYIQPWDFGLSREDVPQLDEQDTMAHWYTISMPQVERWLEGERDKDKLLAMAREKARPGSPGQGRQGLVVSNVSGIFPSGTIQAGFPGDSDSPADAISASVDEPVVTFVDLWERRKFRRRTLQNQRPEVFEDWLVTTVLDDDHHQIFVQRRNPDLPWTRTSQGVVLDAEHPFVAMVPRPLPDYAWGRSELADLRKLQAWLDDHLWDMRKVVKMQLDPAKFYSGVADFEEAGRAMSTPGGSYGSAEPNAKMESLKQELGQGPLQIWKLIGDCFSDASGIPESLTEPGGMPGGVRSEGHFAMAAGIGAGRIRKMALVVEDPIATIASKGFHIIQRHDTNLYERPDGPPFLLSQLPALSFRVDAHSAAPIFSEQTQAKAAVLQKAGAIGLVTFTDLLDPPNRDELKAEAAKREEAKAEMAKEALQIQHEKATKGRAPK